MRMIAAYLIEILSEWLPQAQLLCDYIVSRLGFYIVIHLFILINLNQQSDQKILIVFSQTLELNKHLLYVGA